MTTQKKERFFVLGVMTVGVLLRLVYLWQYSASPLFEHTIGPDVSEYNAWAKRIIAGQLLWKEVDIHAPLYPYFLALTNLVFSYKMFWVRFTQLLLGMATFLPLFFVLKRVALGRDVFRFLPHVFLAMAALYPPLLFYEGEIVSEALLVPLVSLAVFFLYKSEGPGQRGRVGFLLAAGLVSGLAVITHPLSLFFVGLEGLYLLFRVWRNRRRNLKLATSRLLVYGAACAVIVMPVSLYNTYLHGSLVLVQANSGYNLYLGNNPHATGGCYIWPGPDWDRVHGEALDEAKALGISKDQVFLKKTAEFIVRHPVQWLKKLGMKFLYVWNCREMAAGPDLPVLKYFTPIQSRTAFSFGLVAMLSLAGLAHAARRRKSLLKYRHFLTLLVGAWAGLTLTVVSGRYRLMLIPAVLVFAAYGACLLWNCLKRRRVPGFLVGALAVSAAVVWLPSPEIDEQVETAQAYTILGEAYLEAGDSQQAEVFLNLALESLSQWSRSYNILGKIIEERDPDRAEAYYRKAIEVEPGNAYGYMNLAAMYSQKMDVKEAAAYFQKALERGPRDAQVLYNVGYFYFKQGQLGKAEGCFEKAVGRQADHRQAINYLGVVHLLQDRPAEAIRDFSRALRLEPENQGIRVNLAAAFWAKGDPKQAAFLLRKVLDQSPEHPGATALLRQIQQ